jgi:hypothetical protein
MKKNGFFIIMFLSCVSCISINEDGENVGTIHISSVLQVQTHKKSIFSDYASTLKKAIEGTEDDLKSFCLIEFDGEGAYDHGGVLICLIDSIGEKKFLEAVKLMNQEEKELLKFYLRAGMEYGQKTFSYDEINNYHKYYPLIAEQLGEF